MKQQFAQAKGLSPSLLTLSVRTCNCLAGAGLLTDDLLCMHTSSQLMKLRNFGRKCLREVEHYLKARGRQLADAPIPTPIKSDFHSHAAVVAQFANYSDSGLGTLKALKYCVLGIASKAGIMTSKVLRDKEELVDDTRKALSIELGEVLWYFFRCCAELGLDPEKIAAENIGRLRQNRITLAAVERASLYPSVKYTLSPASSEHRLSLTPRQQTVLTCLSKFKHWPTMKELSDNLGLRLVQMVSPISELERKGYVVRQIVTAPSSRTPLTEGRKSELQALAEELPASAAPVFARKSEAVKPKYRVNPRVSTRSIAAELISIFEKGDEDDDQGEDGPGNSRDGEEMVRGAGQEQAD